MSRQIMLVLLVLVIGGSGPPLEAQAPADEPGPAQRSRLLEPALDATIVVHLRFDVLGTNMRRTALPTLDDVEGRGISIEGELTAYDDQWLRLNVNRRQYWIPREMVLFIESQRD